MKYVSDSLKLFGTLSGKNTLDSSLEYCTDAVSLPKACPSAVATHV